MRYTVQDNTKKFYPTAEECKVNNKVQCTEDGCSGAFTSESNLNLHLAKTHRKANLIGDSCKKQYFCPEVGCLYNIEKYFKELKVLRTHYMLKHSSEQFVCLTCSKVFPLQKLLCRHTEYCGVSFACPECPADYAMYESLQTHGRRKKHLIPNKSVYKISTAKSRNDIAQQIPGRLILPRGSLSLIMLPNNVATKFSQESQTYISTPKYKSKTTQVCTELDSQNNQQTQTGSKSQYLTVETQTIGDYYNVSRRNSGIFDSCLTQKSSNTQTDIVQSKNSSCNTSFNEDYFSTKNIETSSSSTQTGKNLSSNNNSSSTHTHDTTYTDTSDLLREDLNINMNSFEYVNCNMQTQTDFIFEDVMFGCDYMSNMYTQTCDEILNDLGFNNIQTQTVFDDMLKSVESQTVMSRKKQGVGDRVMAQMETQTDMEFREMLEVINS